MVSYAYCKGVNDDPYEVVKWYRKAAEQGHEEAIDVLNIYYSRIWNLMQLYL